LRDGVNPEMCVLQDDKLIVHELTEGELSNIVMLGSQLMARNIKRKTQEEFLKNVPKH
tara:strand:+ start:241 stop:414 length:174 start_codon:yes stop_codon:yes gene_type:complete